MIGTFVEDPADEHVRLREALLDAGRVLPPPAAARPVRADRFPDAVAAGITAGLARTGLVLLQLDAPLPDDRFLALGELLGTPIPETDPAVQPYVRCGVILDLVSRLGRGAPAALQPFAADHLTLHSEGSGRPAGEQPRHLVLLCREPGDTGTGAQTVLVPMAAVEDRLDAGQRAVLARTSYRRPGVPPIRREQDGRAVFSFRDFAGAPLEWDGPAGADAALRALLAAMYAPAGPAGLHWTRGLLAIVDNRVFFHGRTAAAGSPGRRRHLVRLRIR